MNENMETRYELPRALRHDARTLVSDARALFDAMSEIADEKVTIARRRLGEALERGKESYSHLHDKVIEGAKVADQSVREHPYHTLALAIGIGALVGICLSRRD